MIPREIWEARELIRRALDLLEKSGWEEVAESLLDVAGELDLAIARRGFCPEHRVEAVWIGEEYEPFVCPACIGVDLELGELLRRLREDPEFRRRLREWLGERKPFQQGNNQERR